MKELDSAKNVTLIVRVLMVLCAVLFLVDFLYHRHSYVPGEGMSGFYAFVGFLAFTGVILGARALRLLIRRDESFYAPNSVDAEEYPEEGLERIEHTESTRTNS
ncbi:MAG: hypothetical protein KTR35_23380 [Gammaproteobacteria bacterium]|nr:hypothetical protein [Gammaproteobacteria bacterium]